MDVAGAEELLCAGVIWKPLFCDSRLFSDTSMFKLGLKHIMPGKKWEEDNIPTEWSTIQQDADRYFCKYFHKFMATN